VAVSQSRTYGLRSNERGFTLPEVLVVIVLMGIVLAIATSSWNGVVESREVDSATNQVASDLRLANTRATNRLVNYRVDFAANGLGYTVEPSPGVSPEETCPDPETPSPTICLPEGTRVTPSVDPVEFRSNGSVNASGSITVASDDGDPSHEIEVVAATSKVQIDP
jgi:prepilin-type N-terminal cleavage/methylation domain-containing protein